MKNFLFAILLSFVAVPLVAQTAAADVRPPLLNIFWYAFDASTADLCGIGFVASIPSGDPKYPHVLIMKVITDFPFIPPSPYVVRVYRDLEASLEAIFVKRWQEDLVGFASGVDGSVLVVTKARRGTF
jgi:hypothetical protein